MRDLKADIEWFNEVLGHNHAHGPVAKIAAEILPEAIERAIASEAVCEAQAKVLKTQGKLLTEIKKQNEELRYELSSALGAEAAAGAAWEMMRKDLEHAEAELMEWKDTANTEQTKWAEACSEAYGLQERLQKAEADNAALREGMMRLMPADGYIDEMMADGEAVNLVTTVGALRQLKKLALTDHPGDAIFKELEGYKRALNKVCTDLACDDQCPEGEPDFKGWPECENCPGCHGEIHQDTERDIKCWERFYLEKALVTKAAPGSCLCNTCKHSFVSGSYRDEVPGCGLAKGCDEFYCPGCDGLNQCQGCAGYENMDQALAEAEKEGD